METQFRLCPVNGSLFGCLPDVDGDCVSDSQVKFLTALYVLGYCKSQLVYFSSGILFSSISIKMRKRRVPYSIPMPVCGFICLLQIQSCILSKIIRMEYGTLASSVFHELCI